MPDAIINRTPAGVPYLDDDNYLGIWPKYTKELANYFAAITVPPADLTARFTDSGWQDLQLVGAWKPHADFTAAWRRIGNIIMLHGELHTGITGTTCFTLPAGARPTTRLAAALSRPGSAAPAALLTIQPDGTAAINGTIPAATPGLSLAGITYPNN